MCAQFVPRFENFPYISVRIISRAHVVLHYNGPHRTQPRFLIRPACPRSHHHAMRGRGVWQLRQTPTPVLPSRAPPPYSQHVRPEILPAPGHRDARPLEQPYGMHNCITTFPCNLVCTNTLSTRIGGKFQTLGRIRWRRASL